MRAPKILRPKEIDGLIVYKIDKFQDERGFNSEIHRFYGNYTPVEHWLFDSFSCSKKNVLRGAHYDNKNDKLIQCLYGKIQFVAFDARSKSPTYKNAFSIILDYKNPTQIYIPVGVANAHLCLSDECVFYYKWSHGYTPQKTKKWNEISVDWLTDKPILSDKDK